MFNALSFDIVYFVAQVRCAAPTVSYAIDRRCLAAYSAASTSEDICSPVCFLCGCTYPMLDNSSQNLIQWVQPLRPFPQAPEGFTFLRMTLAQTRSNFGLETYLERYANLTNGFTLKDHLEDFEDWKVHLRLPHESFDILCCPEDKRCANSHPQHKYELCTRCEIPLCCHCASHTLQGEPKMPPTSLSNDMMIFYAPRELYEDRVTILELICASVCITSMICFTLECRYGNMFDTIANMADARVAARGNATSFPLPWREVLAHLQDAELSEGFAAPCLPHTGVELSNYVHILLKSTNQDDPEEMKHFIHQARVRRNVVVKLITNAKRRGHRAYVNVNLTEVQEKSELLPEDGIPPEIVQLLPSDDALDHIQVQKVEISVQSDPL